MANQELRVGDIVKDVALITQGMRVTWADEPQAPGFVVGKMWEPGIADELVRRVGVRILALPGAAAEYPLCLRCDGTGVAPEGRCPKCGFGAPAAEKPAVPECRHCGVLHPNGVCLRFEQPAALVVCRYCERHGCSRCKPAPPPAPPPPRCAPGCSPAQPCEAIGVCPVWREPGQQRSGGGIGPGKSKVASDIPPAREPRIGALSWSHATACGGLSTRRGR